MEKTLILGRMPENADPKSFIAAGPWCFAGQEDKFPDWEKIFTFAPEPLAKRDSLPVAAHAAQTLCASVIPKLAGELYEKPDLFSERYWQTLLAPWAMDVSRQIIERSLRCQAMREKWRDEILAVPLLPGDLEFNFADEHDFAFRGDLGEVYNHWLFSRLLEIDWPDKWKKVYLPRPEMKTVASPDTGLKNRFFNCLRSLLLKLPFPRLKGLSLGQALIFSAALAHPATGKDHSTPLADFIKPQTLANIPLPDDILPIFRKSLPASIRQLRHAASPGRRAKPRLRVASIVAYENAPYRQTLACWREAGNRLAFVQHGGNYGQVQTACDTEFVEYSQDVFFTWGWQKHGNCVGNFIPMPYPQLAALENRWRGTNRNTIIFVGTEMGAYGYRLDSRPTPLQFIAYRQAKAAFLYALPEELRQRILYRPYFPVPGTLADWPWLRGLFPRVNLCEGSLMPQILDCRLLVLDHHGTTMLEAMAANVPMILYWNRNFWPVTPLCEDRISLLEQAGVWHPGPAQAAEKIRQIWPHVSEWWHEDKVQKARKEFCQDYARLPNKSLIAEWTSALKKL